MAIYGFFTRHKILLIFLSLLFLHIFLRFYQLEERGQFTWDQVDFAWVAKGMIEDGKFPLKGVAIKQNTGAYIGPLYHYLIAPFYYVFNLDPRASLIFAGITSIFTFFIIFVCTLKLFNKNVALVAVFIHTISFFIIGFDRIQWTVNFIAPVSYVIFYALYNVLIGRVKYLFLLAVAIGSFSHIHFTAIFFPLIVFLSLPFFPRTRLVLKYSIISLSIFLVWLLPHLVSELVEKSSSTKNIIEYINLSNHGFHFRRFIQIANEAFIEFETISALSFFKPVKYLFLPLFAFLILKKEFTKKNIILLYLTFLWIFVPWVIFTLYNGEITLYYFSATRPIVIMIISYIAVILFQSRLIFLKGSVLLLFGVYTYFNMYSFFTVGYQGLSHHRSRVEDAIKKGEVIPFVQGNPESYIYYIYTHNKK